MSHAGDSTGVIGEERKRAVLRLILGQLQIIGATAGLILLLSEGVSRQVILVVGTTLILSISSRAIFRRGRGAKSGNVAGRAGTQQQNNYGNTNWH